MEKENKFEEYLSSNPDKIKTLDDELLRDFDEFIYNVQVEFEINSQNAQDSAADLYLNS